MLTLFQLADGTIGADLTKEEDVAIDSSRQMLGTLIADRRRVYGINTGFGALGDVAVDPSQLDRLQRNLIYHLASGVGPPLSWLEARSVVAARLSVLSKGHSGCARAVLEHLM
ncbi:MAG: aromatic amino acid lyase, partial [Pseudomonadota bacterium]